MNKLIERIIKTYILFSLICMLWMGLELLIYGQVHPCAADEIIAAILLLFIFRSTKHRSTIIFIGVKRKKEEPWYTEEWFEEDLKKALIETKTEVTDENIRTLRAACTHIFDDKSMRNEMLSDKALEVFKNSNEVNYE